MYAEFPYFSVLYIQSVLIIYCFICKLFIILGWYGYGHWRTYTVGRTHVSIVVDVAGVVGVGHVAGVVQEGRAPTSGGGRDTVSRIGSGCHGGVEGCWCCSMPPSPRGLTLALVVVVVHV